jgi:hypothetical protein
LKINKIYTSTFSKFAQRAALVIAGFCFAESINAAPPLDLGTYASLEVSFCQPSDRDPNDWVAVSHVSWTTRIRLQAGALEFVMGGRVFPLNQSPELLKTYPFLANHNGTANISVTAEKDSESVDGYRRTLTGNFGFRKTVDDDSEPKLPTSYMGGRRVSSKPFNSASRQGFTGRWLHLVQASNVPSGECTGPGIILDLKAFEPKSVKDAPRPGVFPRSIDDFIGHVVVQ